MSGKALGIDTVGVNDQFNAFSYVINDLRRALDDFPVAADAGSASAELAAVAAAIAAQAERAVLAESGLSDLALEVVNDLLSGDESMAEAVKKLQGATLND